MHLYDIVVKNNKGEDVTLNQYKGKVLLIVNTATGCGFTPQYKGLEKLYETYRDQGFEMLDFPCNQFGSQAPGSDEDIQQFCSLKYDTKFDRFQKVDVNGEQESSLFTYLKEKQGFQGFKGVKAKLLVPVVSRNDKNWKTSNNIKWNFTKFLVDREGNVVQRFEPTVTPEQIEKEVKALL